MSHPLKTRKTAGARFGAPLALGLMTCLLAQGALAQAPDCPTGPAIDGVYVGFEDRTVRYQRLSDGTTSEFEMFEREGGGLFQFHTHPIGLILESWEVSQGRIATGSHETVTLTGTLAVPPAPTPGVSWSGVEESRFSDGSVTRFSTTAIVQQPQSFMIGACQYTGLPTFVTRVEVSSSDQSVDAAMHVVELGVTIYLGTSGSMDDAAQDFPIYIGARPLGEGQTPGPSGRVDNK